MAVSLVLRSASNPASADKDEARAITYDLPRIVIGRGESCDLRLPDLSVSHRHATVRQRGTEYILVDEGSTNGTFIGSVRLSPQSPRVLRPGELVRLGRVWIEVRIEYAAPSVQTALATKELALALVAEALDAGGQDAGPRLLVVDGPDQGKTCALPDAAGPLVLGRGRDVGFELDVVEASRRHARVTRHGDHALLRDLGSKVGTMASGQPVPADRDTVLRPGDVFEIGPDVIRFEFPAVEALRELERSEDEKMPASEVVPPPAAAPDAAPVASSPGSSSPRSSSPRSSSPGVESRPAPAPRPVARPQRRAPEQTGGWGKTDFVVVLLALAVLGMSAVGLVWLFKGM